MKTIEGKIKGRGRKIGIVASKFNEFITRRLLDGCARELKRRDVLEKDITLVWVPGAYEIPVAAGALARRKDIHAVICLGCVLKGETLHYDLVARGAAYGIMQTSLTSGKPVVFAVLAAGTLKLAKNRSEPKGDNKGRDAVITALEMIDVLKQVSGRR